MAGSDARSPESENVMGATTQALILTRWVKGSDLVAFVVCAVTGFLVSVLLPEGPWRSYVSILIFYHLLLAWLLIETSKRVGVAPPVGATILTHLVCVILVSAFATGRDVIPFFVILRYAVGALAFFERSWLFGVYTREEKAPLPTPMSAEAAAAVAEATAGDYDAWLQYLAHRNPLSRKPGMSAQDEYEQWMVARLKARAVSGDGAGAA